MGKFDGVLLCSDIDGTLLTKEGFPEENIKAIKYFQENGGRFTLCTGRLFDFLDKYSHLVLPNAPFIAMNGTMIVDKTTGETLYSCPIELDPGKETEATLRALPYLKAAYVFPEGHSRMVKLTDEGDFDVAVPAGNDEKITVKAKNADDLNSIFGYPDKSKIYKIVFTVATELSDKAKAEITERFRGFTVFRSWINGIEVQSPLADKGKGARMLAKLLGDVKLLVCAGDFENDIAMIEAADIGYAVANAHPPVKEAADRVTKRTCSEGAIAEIIEDLDREIIPNR